MSLLDDIRAELEGHEEARTILEEIWAWHDLPRKSFTNPTETRTQCCERSAS